MREQADNQPERFEAAIENAARRIYNLDMLGMAIDWSEENLRAIIREELAKVS